MLDEECWMKNEFVGATQFHSKNNQNPKQPVFSAANWFYMIAPYSFSI